MKSHHFGKYSHLIFLYNVHYNSVSQTVGRDPKVGHEVLSSGSPKFESIKLNSFPMFSHLLHLVHISNPDEL